MSILEQDSQCYICSLALPLTEFPALMEQHLCENPDTLAIESRAAEMAQNDFEPSYVPDFVEAVCRWGGYYGIAARVLQKNEHSLIALVFKEAHGSSYQGEVYDGLKAISTLNHLGFSFASKHLRFLAPDKAVTLDSIISNNLGYSMDRYGYERFLADCHTLAGKLNESNAKNPLRQNDPWLVCDVEMAIYIKLKKLNPR